MKLTEWLTKNFTHITFEQELMKNGTVLKVPQLNIDLTIGLISTSSKEDYARLVFHYAPAGTIIDEIPDEWYNEHILVVRNILTRMLIEEPNSKMASKYLEILERRDKDRWSKDSKKQTEIKATQGDIKLEFTIVE